MSYMVMAQRIVNGSIIDENRNPVAQATVMVKGTTKQTVTDESGKFSIEANDNDILVVSHISFSPLEVKAVSGANHFTDQQCQKLV